MDLLLVLLDPGSLLVGAVLVGGCKIGIEYCVCGCCKCFAWLLSLLLFGGVGVVCAVCDVGVVGDVAVVGLVLSVVL